MCGLAGFIDRTASTSAPELIATVKRMTDRIVHRGPDDAGSWVDARSGVSLGHRRLSILDLSVEGHQPMHSASGAFVIVFNGEIYNFQDIAKELASRGHRFRGHSDTEVMLAAFEEWGVRNSVDRFNGMFSFAAWDKRTETLHLCRDRIGKKPLYYGWSGNTLLFASELKAFHAHPAFHARIDRNVIAIYLRHGYIPAPYSIYEGVFKLPAGGILTIKESDAGTNAAPETYWSVLDAARRSLTAPFLTEAEALENLEHLLSDSVRIRMIADVPVGAFLSGGIDSSVVVALMRSVSSIPIRTFSIGFHEASHNEAKHAKAVADYLGCVHTELYVTPAEARDVIPKLPDIYDEPFADVSMIPTLLVSDLTRKSVTVALSGDGGDEFFGGYSAYDSCGRYFARNRNWPSMLRRAAASGVKHVPADVMDQGSRFLGGRAVSDRVRRATSIMEHDATGLAYRAMMSQWEYPEQVTPGAVEPGLPFCDPRFAAVAGDEVSSMMLLDAAVYLPDDILVKVDRASMAVSLEARCPILDYRLFELAWRMPVGLKRKDGVGKWPLKDLAYRLIPRTLLDRPKAGFDIPTAEWLRGPLRSWGEDLLDASRLRREGLLNPEPIGRAWKAHIANETDNSARLWNVLMFESWLSCHQNRRQELQFADAQDAAF